MRTSLSFIASVTLLAGCGDNNDKTTDAGVDAPPMPDACVPTSARGTVTRGDIVVPTTERVVFMAMSPPLDRSVLFFSVSEAESSPRFGAIRCELVPENTGAGTPAGLTCEHESPGTDSSPTVPLTIHWEVVTFDQGVKVLRGLTDTSTTNPQNVTLASAVDPAKSFVVLGGAWAGGGGWGSNDFTIAELKNATTLEIRHNVMGSIVPWQVVQIDGAKVQRGKTALTTTDTTKTVTLSNVPAGSIVLATHTNDNASSIIAAPMMLQATLTNTTTLTFNRALAGTAMEVGYEIISLPFAAQSFKTDFAAGEATKTQAVPNLPAASSVAFSTMQAIAGQSSGSTEYADATTLDLVGEGMASLTVSANSVALTRGSATSKASISWNVVDFSNDACN